MRCAVAVIAVLSALVGCAGGDHHHRRFDNAEKWSKVFDDPARDAWQRPDEVMRQLALRGEEAVADIGAGTGYFTVRLARALPRGRVFAVDAEADMARYLRDRAARENLRNVTVVQSSTPVLPALVDTALLVDVYHHIPKRTEYFAELRRSLKPGGRVVVIDFNETSPVGPPARHRIPARVVREELGAAGFVQSQEFGGLPNQYFLEFKAR
jgi:ubiquinone/menaquinone biosynthesis C-methylase UbiE